MYAALAVFVIFAMEANPLMQTAQAATFVDTQRAKAQAEQSKSDEQTAARDLFEEYQKANDWKPQTDPRVMAAIKEN